jgi:hypothetical protein
MSGAFSAAASKEEIRDGAVPYSIGLFSVSFGIEISRAGRSRQILDGLEFFLATR